MTIEIENLSLKCIERKCCLQSHGFNSIKMWDHKVQPLLNEYWMKVKFYWFFFLITTSVSLAIKVIAVSRKKDHKPVFFCWVSLFSGVPRGASACLTTPRLLLFFWYLLIHSKFGIRAGDLQTSGIKGEHRNEWSHYFWVQTKTFVQRCWSDPWW